MTAAIPPALKAVDIARFAHRASQIEKAKPVVAFWCNYWIIEQILSKGLHKTDHDSMIYTTTMMDKLEQTKADNAENDAIIDDLAGQAYIEQFGQETFQRAENAMKADKVSRQTADTFQAAATFLDLCQIWGPLDPEIASQIKFAKYHALRIAKAIKAGEDPNLSNPAPEPPPNPEQALLDPDDPDVQFVNGSAARSTDRQPSVQDVPDEHDALERQLAQRSTHDESLHPSRAPSVPRQSNRPLSAPNSGENFYHNTAPPEVSPILLSSADEGVSDGGGYFPQVPDGVGQDPSFLPDAPPLDPGSPPVPSTSDLSSTPAPSSSTAPKSSHPSGFRENSLHSFPTPNMDRPDTYVAPNAAFPSYLPPPTSTRSAPQNPMQSPIPIPSAPVRQTNPHSMAPPPVASRTEYRSDEESVLNAQKHARWAISALNFEDVKTAVKELRGALESLGAG